MIARLTRAWWAVVAVTLWATGTGMMIRAAVSTEVSWTVVLINSPSLLIVGLAIGVRRPEVRVGQFLALAGGGFAVAALMIEDVASALSDVVTDPFRSTVFAVAVVAGALAVAAIIAALLLFPDGRLPSSRWRWLAWLIGLFAFGSSVRGLLFASSHIDVPFDPATISQHEQLLSQDMLLGIALLLPTLVSLVVRARTGSDVVRRQVGLLAYGVAIYAGFLILAFNTENSVGIALADQLFFTAIPVAIWVAISRHGLYDLGRLVSRTVVYATVVGALAAVYLGAFTVLSGLLPVDTDLGVAAATLAAVAAFNPLRRRIQAAVDQRFFRTHYRTQEVFERFSSSLIDRPDAHSIEAETVELLTDTLAPSSASIWVRQDS